MEDVKVLQIGEQAQFLWDAAGEFIYGKFQVYHSGDI
jgi:hypothetical protein